MPVVEHFTPRALGVKSWGKEILIAETPAYIGKVLWMESGFGGALQFHERKDESFYVFSGRVRLTFHEADGQVEQEILTAGMAVHIPPGAVHQVTAIEDSVLFETSTPVFEDRVIL